MISFHTALREELAMMGFCPLPHGLLQLKRDSSYLYPRLPRWLTRWLWFGFRRPSGVAAHVFR